MKESFFEPAIRETENSDLSKSSRVSLNRLDDKSGVTEPVRELFNNTNKYPPLFLELVIKDPSAYVLDCGSGDRRLNLKNMINFDIADYSGVDIKGDTLNLPFKDNTFDIIISQAVLEHVPDPFKASDELFRVCKGGGYVYVEAAFMQPFHAAPYHFFNITQCGLELLLKKFKKIKSGAFGGFKDIFSWMIKSTNARELYSEKLEQQFLELDKKLTNEDYTLIGCGVFYFGQKTEP